MTEVTRHDIHILACNCKVLIYEGIPCGLVERSLEFSDGALEGDHRCKECGAVATIRGAQFAEALSVPNQIGTGKLYDATLPMPIPAYLAAAHPERN